MDHLATVQTSARIDQAALTGRLADTVAGLLAEALEELQTAADDANPNDRPAADD